MDWNQSTMYEQRVRFILEVQQRTFSFAESCRRYGKPGHPGKPLTPMDEPNAVWTVDFKGQFKMRSGPYCYPLTIQDGFSRFLLECRGLYSTSIKLAKPVFIKTFREFGLPAVIRSDNGTPFASIGLARLTRLSAPGGSVSVSVLRPSSPESRSRTAATNACTELSSAKPLARPRPTSVPSSATSTTSATPSITSARTRLSTMRLPNQSTDRLLELTPRPSLLSSTPNTSRSVKSLQMEASDGTRVRSTSARRWATSSSASNPSVPRCVSSISVPLPSGGLTKNSSSFSTPTATQDVTQSVNHQLAPLC